MVEAIGDKIDDAILELNAAATQVFAEATLSIETKCAAGLQIREALARLNGLKALVGG